jgi:hypothetical protein
MCAVSRLLIIEQLTKRLWATIVNQMEETITMNDGAVLKMQHQSTDVYFSQNKWHSF